MTKAAVETVAENASDGVIAPLLYMLIGGAPLALTYKAINTMDSMLGYKNEKYLYFRPHPRQAGRRGKLSAQPSGGSAVVRGGGPDRQQCQRGVAYLAAGPAQPCQPQQCPDRERVCRSTGRAAGAGLPTILGEYYPKPTIGDALRPIEPEDIRRANKMMYAESLLALLLGLAIRGVIL